MIIALPQLRQGDVSLSKNQSKPPLCKGRWQKSLIFDGGVVKETFWICRTQRKIRNFYKTIPQSASLTGQKVKQVQHRRKRPQKEKAN